jgi:hypothetical protein
MKAPMPEPLDPPPMATGGYVAEAGQAFVKFFGESHNRTLHTANILKQLDDGGCHWACTYPKGKRPRAPKDGAIMFMA